MRRNQRKTPANRRSGAGMRPAYRSPMTLRILAGSLGLFCSLATGCSGGDAPDDGAALTGDDQNVTSADSADTSCRVVLRTGGRVSGTQGPVLIRNQRFVWRVAVDVAASQLSNGAKAKVRLIDRDGKAATDIDGSAVTGGAKGFQRFSFEFEQFSPESSSIDISGVVRLIPFLQVKGSRVFDHNRGGDYSMGRSNRFTIADDASKCASAS